MDTLHSAQGERQEDVLRQKERNEYNGLMCSIRTCVTWGVAAYVYQHIRAALFIWI